MKTRHEKTNEKLRFIREIRVYAIIVVISVVAEDGNFLRLFSLLAGLMTFGIDCLYVVVFGLGFFFHLLGFQEVRW